MRKRSMIILGVGAYTMVSEAANQYTTFLGYSSGFQESDSTARYLLSINPALETIAVFSIPIVLLLASYLVWIRWRPANHQGKKIQLAATIILLTPLILLAITTTTAAISDYNTLHAYHIL
jgi:magnesium-transporting ATPase (P-type)